MLRVICSCAAFLLLSLLTVDALLPRSDWYAPPAWRKAPVFEARLGTLLTLDKPKHACAAFVCTLLVVLALHFVSSLPRRAMAVTAAALVVLWAGIVEFIQGFLAYRNFELLDLAASLVGSSLAVGLWLAAASWIQRRKVARNASVPPTSPTQASSESPG